MKKMNFRLLAMMAVLALAVSATAKTPDVGGVVVDEKGEPMPFVNVVLLSLPDSAFVQGAMTDDQGKFQIVTRDNGALIKVSCIGYQTQYLNVAEGLTIQMKEDALLLSEVVVKSHSFIGGVSDETGKCIDQGARTLHITASNFLGGVTVKG